MQKSLFAVALLLTLVAGGQLSAQTAPAASHFDVRTLGANGDGTNKDTTAFQKALDDCAAAGGGEVNVAAGNYLIGSVILGSHTTLRLEKGARLIGSPDTNDYPLIQIRWEGRLRQGHRGLIYATNASQIAIVGEGSIEGNTALGSLRNPRGPCLIEPVECQNILLDGFSTKFVRLWSIHLAFCENVTARDLTIRSTLSNGDGIDVDSSRHIRIEHCDIDTGDDCIALKSGRGSEGVRIGRPTEDVEITNCILGSHFAGLAIGTELSGGIRHVQVEDCVFTRGDNSIYIKSRTDRAGFIEDITGRNLDCRANTFLVIDLLDKGIKDEEPIAGMAGLTAASRITFSKIKVNVPTLLDAHLLSPDQPLDGLTITDVSGTCTHAINLANLTRVTLRDIHVTGYRGAFLTMTNAAGPGLDKISKPEDTFTAP